MKTKTIPLVIYTESLQDLLFWVRDSTTPFRTQQIPPLQMVLFGLDYV